MEIRDKREREKACANNFEGHNKFRELTRKKTIWPGKGEQQVKKKTSDSLRQNANFFSPPKLMDANITLAHRSCKNSLKLCNHLNIGCCNKAHL